MLEKCIIAVSLLLLLACENEPKPIIVTFQLTHSVDTTFQNQHRRNIDLEIDSLCKADYDRFYQEAIDSLLQLEIRKMEDLLE